MKFFTPNIQEALACEEQERNAIIERADAFLNMEPTHITDSSSPHSAGGPHDYFSQADYSWPNPDTPDGLPYVNRDGESFPGAFFDHRIALRTMRSSVANLTAAYFLTKEEAYAKAAVRWLREFFLDDATKMNPSLLYGQAILGECTGRGIGIIDTLHLIDVPVAADLLFEHGQMDAVTHKGLRDWFSDYLEWISTHQYGINEMNVPNNHSVCWAVQAGVYARFTGNEAIRSLCVKRFKEIMLPNQMAVDGSFPLEIARTKPYGYSIFVLDNFATLAFLLSTPQDNLWEFILDDGRSLKKGFDYLYPFLEDPSSWPHKTDIAYHHDWPMGMSFMLFAYIAYGDKKWLELYSRLEKYSPIDEVRRNTAIRVPYLWLRSAKG
ncbi:MAG: alginate lyase family protein [Treponema sp.]|nr:alginate lyase family protein [Treponema sp.]